MGSRHAALAVCGAIVAYFWCRRNRTFTISDVPGPMTPSWVYGHLWWWAREDAGSVEKAILEEYGTVVRWNGTLGEERLWVADPKAIHHILQSSSHLYQKPHAIRQLFEKVMDRGLVWAEGDVHKRQRRAMTSAFGPSEVKALYPYFTRCSDSLSDKWHETISKGESGRAAIIDVHSWLSKATLDAIGAGAFDYDFGAVENTGNKLTKSYTNLTHDAFCEISKRSLFVMDALKWAPTSLATWIFNRNKSPGMVKLRENKTYAREVATKLVEDKRQELKDGTTRKDVLSLLVKANSALRPDLRLSDEEILAQVRTIMFAGHETTTKALVFVLWELAKNRDVQERLRVEIAEMLGRVRVRGDDDFTVNDFDSMPYLLAVVKETLRVHPPVVEIPRTPKKDTVLPLSKPVVGVSGKVYNGLLVPAGTPITLSTVGSNLNKDLWGPDAYEFRPERWLDKGGKPESSVGVYSNLLTFSGGPRSCIGWRYAVIEIHAFLVTLLRQFDFTLPDNGQGLRVRSGGAVPMVVGEEHKGPQMPLKVTVLANE